MDKESFSASTRSWEQVEVGEIPQIQVHELRISLAIRLKELGFDNFKRFASWGPRDGIRGLNKIEKEISDKEWDSAFFANRFWHIAYHALFYERLYLFESLFEHIPWVRHQEDAEKLSSKIEVYSQKDILDFMDVCREHTIVQLKSMNLGNQSKFPWLKFGSLERITYNLRHFQHHVDQLAERIRQSSGEGVPWIANNK